MHSNPRQMPHLDEILPHAIKKVPNCECVARKQMRHSIETCAKDPCPDGRATAPVELGLGRLKCDTRRVAIREGRRKRASKRFTFHFSIPTDNMPHADRSKGTAEVDAVAEVEHDLLQSLRRGHHLDHQFF